ncbi:hypothetical protein [Arsenicicoccus dermatophilus]|uniref:hypothetical protein n=1 Tax=Arsenicicoccus dermatophilus TaxID=1076331 RepID=UPI001F4CBBC2|nr:hypothetical protein [Arsenicicoccus dermatophilus]MCH8613430.1 hypothetical protein [Arsenicicoccus dermatophilus]
MHRTNDLYSVDTTTDGTTWAAELTPSHDHTARLLLSLAVVLRDDRWAGLRTLTATREWPTTSEIATAVGGHDVLRSITKVLTVTIDGDTTVDNSATDGLPAHLLSHRSPGATRPAAEPRDCHCGDYATPGSELCGTCLRREEDAADADRAAMRRDQDLTYRIGA